MSVAYILVIIYHHIQIISMISLVVLMLFIFTLSQLDQGSKYCMIFLPHPLLIIKDKTLVGFHINSRRLLSLLLLLSVLLSVLSYQNHINDFFSIYDDFILHYQHMIINGFISCKLKQDTSYHFILFW